MFSRFYYGVLHILLFSLISSPAYSTVMTFTDRASFFNEIFNLNLPDIRILDFEDPLPGDPVPSGSSLDGITFTYSIDDGMGGSLDMIVTDLFDTTSGNNYLGLDDPGNLDQFIAGDSFNLNLGGPFNALGLFFITGDPLFAGDILLQTPVGTALNSDLEEGILDDGGLVYFVGLVSPDLPFGLAQIRFDPAAAAVGAFLYNVDDIVTAKVSEPGTAMLILIGLLGLLKVRFWSQFNRGEIS